MAIRKIVAKDVKPVIRIIEHDRWSGPSVIGLFEADSLQEAQKYCDDYNSESCPELKSGESVPDYYVTAEIL